jgi:hypothetical protein
MASCSSSMFAVFFVAALASSTSAGAHARLQVLFSTQYMDSVLISSVTD